MKCKWRDKRVGSGENVDTHAAHASNAHASLTMSEEAKAGSSVSNESSGTGGDVGMVFTAGYIIQNLGRVGVSPAAKHTHHFHKVHQRPNHFRCCTCCMGVELNVTYEGESPVCSHRYQNLPYVESMVCHYATALVALLTLLYNARAQRGSQPVEHNLRAVRTHGFRDYQHQRHHEAR